MKTLGLIGGTTWLSTVDYYRYLNEGVNRETGGKEFARCIIYSLDFTDMKKLTQANDWDSVLRVVTDAGRKLEQSGAAGSL